jgi:glucose-1-phosphate thymidylyltransferase
MKKIKYGVILAAGLGTRLYPLTKFFPKLILPIFNKPLILHHLEIMKLLGIEKVYIIVSDINQNLISETIQKEEGLHIQFEFKIQDFLGGTGHALLQLKNELKNSRFFLMLGDEYFNDLTSFPQLNSLTNYENILGIIEYNNIKDIMASCNVSFKNGTITKLTEKPKESEIHSKWCWDGTAVLTSDIMDTLEDMSNSDMGKRKDYICIVKAMQIMMERKKSFAYSKRKGFNINISNDIDLLKANFLECTKKYNPYEIIDALKTLKEAN